MQASEFVRGLQRDHRQNVDGGTGRGGLSGHVGAVLGDQDVVGELQEGEIGVGPFAVPDQAGQVGQSRGHGRPGRLGRAARECQHQRAAGGLDGGRDLPGQRRGMGFGQVEGAGTPADQGGDAGTGQGFQPVREGDSALGHPRRRHPVRRAGDRQHMGTGQAVMGGGDDQVIGVVSPARVLRLHHEGPAARSRPDLHRQRQGGAAGGDPQVRPGLTGGGFDRIG